MRLIPDIFKFVVTGWMKLKINFQKSHPQTSETAIGAVVGTDLEQMWVIYLFC